MKVCLLGEGGVEGYCDVSEEEGDDDDDDENEIESCYLSDSLGLIQLIYAKVVH